MHTEDKLEWGQASVPANKISALLIPYFMEACPHSFYNLNYNDCELSGFKGSSDKSKTKCNKENMFQMYVKEDMTSILVVAD